MRRLHLAEMELSKLLVLLACFTLASSAGTYKGPPQADKKQLTKMARLGEDIRLLCPMSGFPVPLISWTKGKEHIDSYSWDRYKPSKKSLKILDVTMEDTGTYVCKGTNGFGSEEIKIDLIVIDPSDFPNLSAGELPDVAPPIFSESTRAASSQGPIVRRSGENLRLPCEALGKPEPDVYWVRVGDDVRSMGGGVDKSSGGRATLIIKNLIQSDSGTFACVAKNMVGVARTNFTLKVEDSSHHPALPNGPRNTTVLAGQEARLECHIRSPTGAPSIKWLKKLDQDFAPDRYSDPGGGEVIAGEEGNYRLVRTVEAAESTVLNRVPGEDGRFVDTLVIPRANAQDEGVYYCFVTNSIGFKYKSAYLTVKGNVAVTSNGDPSSSGSEEDLSSNPALIFVVCLAAVMATIAACVVVLCIRKKANKKENKSSSNNASFARTVASSTLEAGEVQENLIRQPQQQQQHHLQEQQPPIIKQHPHHYQYQQQQHMAANLNNNRGQYSEMPPPPPPMQAPPPPPPSVHNDTSTTNSWTTYPPNTIINDGQQQHGYYKDPTNQYEEPHVYVSRPGGSGGSSGSNNGRYQSSLYGGGGGGGYNMGNNGYNGYGYYHD